MGEQLKQRLVRGLRGAGLLDEVDRLIYLRERWRCGAQNRSFLAGHAGERFPPYPILFDAFGSCDLRSYYTSGQSDARFIAAALRRLVPGARSICEWGCGPARVLRHLGGEGFTRLLGTDYNPQTIDWCRTAIPGAEFGLNGLGPPLPAEAGSLDALYAISVFTHLSEQRQLEWAAEVRRVLKPGGAFLFTVHGERCTGKLLPDERARFDQGLLVVREKVLEGKKHFVSYESEAFVRGRLLAGFGEVERIDWPGFPQDTWAARPTR
jgi:SAM-dependent methyltransferase